MIISKGFDNVMSQSKTYAITADLEPRLHVVNSLHLLTGQRVAIERKVLLDSPLGDTLGDNRPLVLKTPQQQALLDGQVLLFSEIQQCLVLVEGRVS